MRVCAPWLLSRATRQEAERIAVWAAEKRSRRRRPPVLKLFIFPGQHHSRKASLILTSTDLEGLQPRLEIRATASNARLYESGWQGSEHATTGVRLLFSLLVFLLPLPASR
jgi:hypothetical protein